MKNIVLTFLLALLVVVTAISLRRMVAGNATSTGPLVAIGTSPVPSPQPPPPPPPPPPPSK